MITFDIKMPSVADLMRAATEEIERDITKKAQSAAEPHGGVTVRFERSSEGASAPSTSRGQRPPSRRPGLRSSTEAGAGNERLA